MLTLADVQRAASIVEGEVLRTPCRPARRLSEQLGASLYMKLENLQYTGAFKERGALVKLSGLDAASRARGVIAASAGNHAQGVAYHAKRLGIGAVIVMPRFTPANKVERTEELGARVVLHGDAFDDAKAFMETLAEEEGRTVIHPFDDPEVIAGQGTIALEMLADEPRLDTLVVPIGGGGLIGGMALAAKALRPEVRIVGVQTKRFPSMVQAVRGEPIRCGQTTLAEGIAVREPGRLTRQLVERYVDDLVTVSESDLERAILLLLREEKVVAEGAGAAGLAAVLAAPESFAGRSVGLTICGGNIDLLVLSSIIERGLVRGGRMVRLRVSLRDVAGALAGISTLMGEIGANIIEVQHLRAFSAAPIEAAEVVFTLLTRGTRHLDALMLRLEEAGYAPERLE